MISIIIPAHNEGSNLIKLIPYLLAIGNGQRFEIIICRSFDCNDNVPDNWEQDKVQFIRSEQRGRAPQMNKGATLAKGENLCFLHADVLPPASFFKDITDTLNDGFDAGFFSYRFDRPGLLFKINASFTTRDGIFTGGGDQCLFIRKSVFEQLGRFDNTQLLMEDFEFFRRMKKEKVPYKIVKNELIVSARKYTNNSYVRVNLSNLLLLFLFRLGYPSEKLKTLHNRLIRMSE